MNAVVETKKADASEDLRDKLKLLRVLIVDKHNTARLTLRAMLQDIGIIKIESANSYQDAMQRLHNETYHVILVDYVLEEGRDGLSLLEELRQKRLIPMITVYIVTTSERAHQNVIAVAELEPDAYILKPFTEDILSTRIIRSINKKLFCRPVYSFLDKRIYSDAILACDKLLNVTSPFKKDVLRMKGKVLNTLERYTEAFEVYKEIHALAPSPAAQIGLARALHGLGKHEEAATIAGALVSKHREFMEAYDFLAKIHEEKGDWGVAQSVLQKALLVSPRHTQRHQDMADIAVNNNDMETAERSYLKVLAARRGSSLLSIDDYANVARTSLSRGKTAAARTTIENMRREWRTDKNAELAALVLDSLCFTQEKMATRAAQVLQQAIDLHEEIGSEAISQRITVDIAHSCLINGKAEIADDLLRKVAAENHGNHRTIAQIQAVFSKEGKAEEGKNLLQGVDLEIIGLNNSGIRAAQSGDLEGAVKILMETVERVPNLQFLINASKAIFTLLGKKSWDDALAERGLSYLRLAYKKDSNSARVISACDLYQRVAKQYKHPIQSIEQDPFFA